MHVCNANCQYADAETTWHDAMQYMSRLQLQHHVTVNAAALYSEYSTLLFARSQYEEVTHSILVLSSSAVLCVDAELAK